MRALLSVADREGISAFAGQLRELGVEVYATDGTREHLAGEGIEVAPVSDLTHVADYSHLPNSPGVVLWGAGVALSLLILVALFALRVKVRRQGGGERT